MFKKKLQTLDFQVLVYQAPPQSARFLGTFHNVLTKLAHNGELHEMAHFEEAQDAHC